jgi:hypothetical protein
MNHLAAPPAALPPDRRQPGSARLIEWKPWPRPNTLLLGHATVDFGGWIISKIPVFRRGDGTLSAGSPSGADVDGDGQQRRETDGKPKWWTVITFATPDDRKRWSCVVLGALDDARISSPGVRAP